MRFLLCLANQSCIVVHVCKKLGIINKKLASLFHWQRKFWNSWTNLTWPDISSQFQLFLQHIDSLHFILRHISELANLDFDSRILKTISFFSSSQNPLMWNKWHYVQKNGVRLSFTLEEKEVISLIYIFHSWMLMPFSQQEERWMAVPRHCSWILWFWHYRKEFGGSETG